MEEDGDGTEKVLFINSNGNNGFSPDGTEDTMTVAELIRHLTNFDKDDKVYLNNEMSFRCLGIGDFDEIYLNKIM